MRDIRAALAVARISRSDARHDEKESQLMNEFRDLVGRLAYCRRLTIYRATPPVVVKRQPRAARQSVVRRMTGEYHSLLRK